MEPMVIDAIRAAADDQFYPGLYPFIAKDDPKSRAEFDAITEVPDGVNVDDDTRRRLSDWACDVCAFGDERGFRDGFRLAVRLMMECLPAPEYQAILKPPKAPEKGDGA